MKKTLSVFTICSMQYAICNFTVAQNNNGLWFGLGPDTTFTNRHVKINKGMTVLEKLVAKEIAAGKITADSIIINGNMTVEGQVSADSMKVSNILPPEGDSIIHFGKNSVSLNLAANRISWTPVTSAICPGGIRGLSIGNGFILPLALGLNSIAIGSTATNCNATNSIAMGTGFANSISNTFMVGFGNTAIYADATRVGIFTTGPTQTLDVNGTARIRNLTGAPHNFVVTSETNGTLHSIAFTGNANDVLLGNGTFGPASTAANAWVLGGNLNATNFSKLGADIAGVDLNIYAGQQQAMFIDGGLNPLTFGNVGIGTNFSNPGQLLDVNGGDIDINTTTRGYMINNNYVLRHNGDVSSILVGVGAGAVHPANANLSSTFVGNNAGFNNVGALNTFLGFQAGQANFLGDLNTCVGWRSGLNISPQTIPLQVGAGNSFLGGNSGINTQFGNSNTFIGSNSGNANIDGNNNTLLGQNTNVCATCPNLNNAAALGSGAIVTASDKMILGDNLVNVGIGLSGVAGGPQNRLEINNSISGTDITPVNPSGSTGLSGLRFRDLTSASVAEPTNPAGTVLSVNSTGDVILVTDQGAVGPTLNADNGLSVQTDPNIGTPHVVLGGLLHQHTYVDFTSSFTNFNLNFPGNTMGQGFAGASFARMGIGPVFNNSITGVHPDSKLHVYDDFNYPNSAFGGPPTATNFLSGTLHSVSNVINPAGDHTYTAGYFEGITAVANAAYWNRGVYGFASNAPFSNIGGHFRAITGTSTTSPNSIAVFAEALGTAKNFGVQSVAKNGTDNYGIFASGTGPTVPTIFGNWGGVFSGRVFVNDPVTLISTTIPSDRQLKKDTAAFTNGLNVIRNINAISYRYNGKAGLDTSRTFIGVIAENLASVAPYTVDTFFAKLDSADAVPTALLSVANEAILYTSLNAIKQLDSAVTVLQNAPGGVTGTGAANYLTKWQNANTVTSSSVFDNGTNVGIGMTAPFVPLTVTSDATSKVGVSVLENSSAKGVEIGVFNGRGFIQAFDRTNSVAFPYYFAGSTIGFVTGDLNPTNSTKMTILNNGNVGIGTTVPTEKLHVIGNILATGTITQNSDANLKQNIDSIPNALNIISQLMPHTFNFDTTNYSYLGLPSGKQFGLTAQEAETILPEIVSNSFFPQVNTGNNSTLTGNSSPETPFKTVNYTALIPILIKGMQEQQGKITQLESAVSGCCSTNSKTTQSSNLPSTEEELASRNSILYQNIPNPFGDGTSIGYFLAENVSSAYIIFYDEFGNEVKKADLPYRGQNAKLNLTTSNLAAGIYSYSLIVNEKVVDTKKMLKTK